MIKIFLKNPQFLKIVYLIIPFILWLFVIRNFSVNSDNYVYYHWIKYFLDGISQGEFPLWDPFYAWGSPDHFDMRFIGEFNPFLYIVLLFGYLGLSFDQEFSVYLAVYYFFGAIGFFLLAKQFFDDEHWAYISYLLFLFSSLGVILLGQLVIVLMLFPAVWFFYFITAFIKSAQIKYFVGVTFSLMIIVTTYMPFHFLSFLIPVAICFICVYFKDLRKIFWPTFRVFYNHRWVTLLCLFSLILSLIPGVYWYVQNKSDQYTLILPGRSSTEEKQGDFVGISSINAGGLSTEMHVDELFSYLSLGQTRYFFVSIFLYLVIFLSLINSWNRKLWILLFTGLFVLFQSLADATPLHAFLYENIIFYRLFRNYFFFSSLLISLFILFSVEQLRLFLHLKSENMKKNIMVLMWVILVHVLFGFYLYQLEYVVWTSQITIALSLIFFTFYFLSRSELKNSVIFVILSIIVLIQPIEVCFHHFKNNYGSKMEGFNERWMPNFSYVRPIKERPYQGYAGYRGSLKLMKDESGFLNQGYAGAKASFIMHERMDHEKIQEYVRHKFILYDHVRYLPKDVEKYSQVENALFKLDNIAFVSDESVIADFNNNENVDSKALIIAEDSKQFQVLKFGLNKIKFRTNFPQKKFLVYNDSYHNFWQAFVNGKQVEIFKSNIAFKAIELNSGENIVYFRYGPWWLEWMFKILVLYFFGFIIYLLMIFMRSKFND